MFPIIWPSRSEFHQSDSHRQFSSGEQHRYQTLRQPAANIYIYIYIYIKSGDPIHLLHAIRQGAEATDVLCLTADRRPLRSFANYGLSHDSITNGAPRAYAQWGGPRYIPSVREDHVRAAAEIWDISEITRTFVRHMTQLPTSPSQMTKEKP